MPVADTPTRDIPGIVAEARKAFNEGVTRPIAFRRQQLEALGRLVAENVEAIGDALKKDLGVNNFFVNGVECEVVRQEVKRALEKLNEWTSPKVVGTPVLSQPGKSMIVQDPYGVVLLMAPWNYPVSLVLAPMVAALAAGNTIVVKPSEISENVSQLLEKLCAKYLDQRVVKFVQGGIPPSTALLEQRFDFIYYTGNSTVARIVHKAANKHLTPTLLELGGKSPCYVAPDCNLSNAAKRIIWGKFTMNMGQTCITPDYIMTTPAMLNQVVAELRKTITEFYGPEPKESPDVSRLISVRHAKRVAAMLEDDKIEVLTGGQVSVDERYIAPTLVRAEREAKVMQEEIFGPILPIIMVRDEDDALAYVNAHEKPLALYVFSESKATQERFTSETSAGGMCINDTIMHCGNFELPFGGVGESGMGAYHGHHGFLTFSHAKAVFVKYGNDAALRFPPYTDSKMYWLGLINGLDIPRILSTIKWTGGIALAAVAAYFARKHISISVQFQ